MERPDGDAGPGVGVVALPGIAGNLCLIPADGNIPRCHGRFFI